MLHILLGPRQRGAGARLGLRLVVLLLLTAGDGQAAVVAACLRNASS